MTALRLQSYLGAAGGATIKCSMVNHALSGFVFTERLFSVMQELLAKLPGVSLKTSSEVYLLESTDKGINVHSSRRETGLRSEQK